MIALGHPPTQVWKYTPRQMWAFLFIAGKRQDTESRRLLALHTMAARGEMRQVKKAIRGTED